MHFSSDLFVVIDGPVLLIMFFFECYSVPGYMFLRLPFAIGRGHSSSWVEFSFINHAFCYRPSCIWVCEEKEEKNYVINAPEKITSFRHDL